ncbi:hypothetical protein BCR44DRAFT_1427725 [Catenaria anguillulae PL171]|uniref:Uncharacterized protein n=1 Tax=Catenaria anguillulae PL171 TaxID=765915 RepID=A0A1Y2HXR9_9FUNG|nr:hypothetical protein BCR44DRAFT_1427725 [Catenaria anguillulae PL171]
MSDQPHHHHHPARSTRASSCQCRSPHADLKCRDGPDRELIAALQPALALHQRQRGAFRSSLTGLRQIRQTSVWLLCLLPMFYQHNSIITGS